MAHTFSHDPYLTVQVMALRSLAWTQHEIADALGISQQTVSRYMRFVKGILATIDLGPRKDEGVSL